MIMTALLFTAGFGCILYYRRLTGLTNRLKQQSPSESEMNLSRIQYYAGGFLLISMGPMRLFLW
jgi:hypothetical protein